MIKYLLDTCVISDFVKGEPNTLKRIKNTSPTAISISTITVMEIFYGLQLNPEKAIVLKPIITEFLSAITISSFDAGDAKRAAEIRAYLKQKGSPIGSYDILLAGAALNQKLILVTSNTKEFERVEGVVLEDWRT